jgi:DNA-binding NtrC family response regulator
MGPSRVLVVDDDPDILSSLASLLGERLGASFEVMTAGSAGEAKRRIEEGERFDLVLTDEQMPGMRGTELLTWLRASQPATARALMSGQLRSDAAGALSRKAGAEAFFAKPFDIDAMLRAVRGLLGRASV